MKKLFSLSLIGASAALLAACANGIPECNNNQLDGCGRGGAYTDERTAVGRPVERDIVVQEQVIVEPAPAVTETTTIVVEEPAPAPADTSIMRQAPEPSQAK